MINIKPNKEKALYLAKRLVNNLVYDAVNLEGINYTLVEVATILDGITIGGHKISDQQIVINQKNAWDLLFYKIKNDTFKVNKQTACEIHNIAGFDDALLWGQFRNKDVFIAGTTYLPPNHLILDNLFNQLCNDLENIHNIYDKAIYMFLNMARNQYFFDINKRTGRFMMNGILLNAGYPIINVKASDKLEFNTLMLDFYLSNNIEPMSNFLKKSIDSFCINFMNS